VLLNSGAIQYSAEYKVEVSEKAPRRHARRLNTTLARRKADGGTRKTPLARLR